METEEAVLDLPGFEEGFTDFEEGREPCGGTDVGIEGLAHVINHPEDGFAGFGLAEMIAVTGVVHLVGREMTGSDEGMEEVEVVSTTGFNHRHRGYHQIDLMFDG
jgi:hypothetical protein